MGQRRRAAGGLSEPRVRIDVVRSGGFAGMTMRSAVDTAELPPEQAARLEQAIERIDFAELQRAPSASASKVDRFQYDLIITDDDRRQQLSTGEEELPPELRQLLDELLRRR